MKPIVISLDGNIGAGKTTMLGYLRKEYPNIHYIDEPVDTWMNLKDENGNDLLSLFYKDTPRWAYTLQNCAFITRVNKVKHAIKEWKEKCKTNPEEIENNVFITERSILTDRYVFAEMLKTSGQINCLEWNLYLEWFNSLSEYSPIDAIIEVVTNYDECKERICKRGRKGEESIGLNYLSDLENQHNKWLSTTSLPVLKITSEMSELPKVKSFINELK